MRKIIIYANARTYLFLGQVVKMILHFPNSHLVPYTEESQTPLNDEDLFIFVQIFPSQHIGKKNAILFNTEQLTSQAYHQYIVKILETNKVVDYNHENVFYIEKHHGKKNNYFWFPFPWCPKLLYPLVPKNYPFVHIGQLTDRRKSILNKIQEKHNVLVIENRYNYETLMLDHICQGKILINIHYKDDYLITETARCFPALYNKLLVVSEESYDMSVTHQFFLNKYIIFSPYANLISKCLWVYDHYDEAYQEVFKDFDEKTIKDKTFEMVEETVKKLLN